MNINKDFTNLVRSTIELSIRQDERLPECTNMYYGFTSIECYVIGDLYIIDLATTRGQWMMGENNANIAIFRDNIIEAWNSKYAFQLTEDNIFINVEDINPFKKI